MKIITISKIGYNAPSNANWSYGIWKIDLIDTKNVYNMSYTVKEKFGGDSRLRSIIKEQTGYEILETKGVYTKTGTPKITGISEFLDIEGKEFIQTLKDFISK